MLRFRPIVACLAAAAMLASSCGSGAPEEARTEQDALGPEASGLVLTADGIGAISIGQPFDDVRTALADEIGGWDIDSGDRPDVVHVPTCDGDTTRLVGWGNLTLLFTGDPDDLRFATWTYGFDPVTGSAEDVRALGLVTPEGIGLGSSRTDITAAYGDRATYSDASTTVGTVVVLGNASEPHLEGRLENDRLVLMERTPTCTV